jgi:hypothetical protein
MWSTSDWPGIGAESAVGSQRGIKLFTNVLLTRFRRSHSAGCALGFRVRGVRYGPDACHGPSVPRYTRVGAPGAAVSAGRAEPTDQRYFDSFETNLLSARHADAGQ